ncbi:SEFIR domain-containing protein [Paraliobacillus ryukyuensis]|uniref:SEFIR domain-containing protein n=1 Tax=Paraliobacillus ryukyuensis TaxID=200904 RepID=UPI0009A6A5B1|nr:SEFIR domain-containing protein [Paraliobacillus ryukyuensis]
MEYEEIAPKVFISYSWSSETHKQWVLDLAEELVKKSGVDVILDRWHGVVGHDRFQFSIMTQFLLVNLKHFVDQIWSIYVLFANYLHSSE